ncbi:MAG: protein translocase subunit SecD [Candidatus Paceibacterota bacterium]
MSDKSAVNSGSETFLRFFRAFVTLGVIGYLAFSIYNNVVDENAKHPFKLGLDLAGGSHLVYEADVSNVDPIEVSELMNVLRDVIERRINTFGVSEPIVYVESSSFVSEEKRERLVIELPGITDVGEAVAEIGRTPLLEFKLIDREKAVAQEDLYAKFESGEIDDIENFTSLMSAVGDPYIDTGLTGRYLETAKLEFTSGQGGQMANEPIVSIKFNAEGGDLFASITRENVGEQLAIFLDGEIISAPRINEAITGGTAIVSGGFTPEEARELAKNLSFGALPLPISLASTQTVGSTLGQEVLDKGVTAGLIGLSLVVLFMVLWYRLPGLISGLALVGYIVLVLALFQLIPVTITAAGLAGLIISIGMAVDANVLVFERMKEELLAGKGTHEAAKEGFSRAWGAIRDGNVTSILSAVILFWFGTSMVKGFALVFGIGVIASMISAIVITRTLLMAIPDVKKDSSKFWSFLLSSGFSK